MALEKLKAVIGTNSWGSALYGKLLRGSSVSEDDIRQCAEEAVRCGLSMFDTAQDYGLGKGQKMIGALCPEGALISSKFTPVKKYRSGQVHEAFNKDLEDFGRSGVEVYWLHLPNNIEENLAEIISLQNEGKIKHVGVSNFNLEECKLAKDILGAEGIALYGVQNHYSVISRDWEKNGLLDWCKENCVSFWAWAVLEEGILIPPKKKEKSSIMKAMFNRKRKKLAPLFSVLEEIGATHSLTVPQVSMAFCATKGIVPVCGCRRKYQVEQLYAAVGVTLSPEEIKRIEDAADSVNITVLSADLFRFAVGKK